MPGYFKTVHCVIGFNYCCDSGFSVSDRLKPASDNFTTICDTVNVENLNKMSCILKLVVWQVYEGEESGSQVRPPC
jgi:hypothetical protein